MKPGLNYQGWLKKLPMTPTLAQHRACLFLERQGYKFLVDFGVLNAVERAKAERATIKQEYRKARKGRGGFRSRRWEQ